MVESTGVENVARRLCSNFVVCRCPAPLDKELVRTEQYGGKEYDITTRALEHVYDAKLRWFNAAILCIIVAQWQAIGKTNNVYRSSKYRVLYQVFAGWDRGYEER